MKLVDPKLTEHLYESGRWPDCARLFLHDPNKYTSKSRIRIKGCNVDFYLYQAFEIFVMFKMEMFQGGGYNADDMRLGRVREVNSLKKLFGSEMPCRPMRCWDLLL